MGMVELVGVVLWLFTHTHTHTGLELGLIHYRWLYKEGSLFFKFKKNYIYIYMKNICLSNLTYLSFSKIKDGF